MKLWSRGLGKTEVTMDFERYGTQYDGTNLLVIGNMIEPVQWEFKIIMSPEDMIGFMKLLFTWPMLRYIVKNFWRGLLAIFRKSPNSFDPKRFEEVERVYKMMVEGRRR